jgi:hypothetical protein
MQKGKGHNWSIGDRCNQIEASGCKVEMQLEDAQIGMIDQGNASRNEVKQGESLKSLNCSIKCKGNIVGARRCLKRR